MGGRVLDLIEETTCAPGHAEVARPLPLAPAPRIVAIGGGTGVPVVLSGLAGGRARPGGPLEVTAIVTTADDGGSSGALRREQGIPAVGDVRNCLVALAPPQSPLARLFQHRFAGSGGLAGHTVGNIVLAALAERLGTLEAAVSEAARLLGASGRVLPATGDPVELVALLEDGRTIRGESKLAGSGAPVRRLALAAPARPNGAALEAIARADVVVLGPGSLFTSVLATVVVDGVAEALRETGALRVLVVNLFTEPGETDGFTAEDHLLAVRRHAGPVVDVVVVHAGALPAERVARYAARGAAPVPVDRAALERHGVRVVAADVLSPGPLARHDPAKLGAVLCGLAGS